MILIMERYLQSFYLYKSIGNDFVCVKALAMIVTIEKELTMFLTMEKNWNCFCLWKGIHNDLNYGKLLSMILTIEIH